MSDSDAPVASTSSVHLTFPIPEKPPALPAPLIIPAASSSKKNEILSDRLYVGNLHPTVDESGLLKIFSKCGKVSRLDYLFHKSGPAKGKPRGYAFVEFATPKEAKKAVDTLHDRVLRGRKLIVSFAEKSSHPPESSSSGAFATLGGGPGPIRRRHDFRDDAPRTTTLSLIKTPASSSSSRKSNKHEGGGGGGTGGDSANANAKKIAAMEAKLKELREQPPTGAVPNADRSGLASLPRKPAPPRGGYGPR